MKKIFLLIALSGLITNTILAQMKPITALTTVKSHDSELLKPDLDLSAATESKKSVFLAVVASLAMPGMGELYAGSFESGKYHLMAEGALWLTYTGFRLHSNWLLQDAKTFAQDHSGANFNNKDDQFLVDIGNFNSTEEYNDTKSRNRQYNLIYQPTQLDYQWTWDSDANRNKFKDMRIQSGTVKNNSKFIIGAIVVNHLLSAFSAGKKTAAYNRSLSMNNDWEINTYTMNNGTVVDGCGISITAHF